MKVIVDRIEGKYAVIELEDGTTFNLPILLVPSVKEGDVIKIELEKEETKKRAENIKNLMQDVFK